MVHRLNLRTRGLITRGNVWDGVYHSLTYYTDVWLNTCRHRSKTTDHRRYHRKRRVWKVRCNDTESRSTTTQDTAAFTEEFSWSSESFKFLSSFSCLGSGHMSPKKDTVYAHGCIGIYKDPGTTGSPHCLQYVMWVPWVRHPTPL